MPLKWLSLLAFPLAATVLASAALAQDAEGLRPSRGHHLADRRTVAPVQTSAATANLNVPATDFSQLKPVMPTSPGQQRGGRRRRH